MPTYEYTCSANHKVTAIQRITDKPLKACVKCGKPCKRIPQITSFVLKGQGWAKTNYDKK